MAWGANNISPAAGTSTVTRARQRFRLKSCRYAAGSFLPCRLLSMDRIIGETDTGRNSSSCRHCSAALNTPRAAKLSGSFTRATLPNQKASMVARLLTRTRKLNRQMAVNSFQAVPSAHGSCPFLRKLHVDQSRGKARCNAAGRQPRQQPPLPQGRSQLPLPPPARRQPPWPHLGKRRAPWPGTNRTEVPQTHDGSGLNTADGAKKDQTRRHPEFRYQVICLENATGDHPGKGKQNDACHDSRENGYDRGQGNTAGSSGPVEGAVSATYLVAARPRPAPARTPKSPWVLWIMPTSPNPVVPRIRAARTDAAKVKPRETTAPKSTRTLRWQREGECYYFRHKDRDHKLWFRQSRLHTSLRFARVPDT